MKNITVRFQDNSKIRLDEFLALQIGISSRSYASKLIRNSKVFVNKKIVVKPSYLLTIGDKISFSLESEKKEDLLQGSFVPFEVISEDENKLVINKPAGVVVHPGAGNKEGTLVSGLINYWGKTPEELISFRMGLVHRLDKDTSGVLLVAKNLIALTHYSEQFKSRKIYKKYLAITYGRIPNKLGIISSNIGRHRSNRKKMCVLESSGRYAETHYKVLATYKNPKNESQLYTLVELTPKTGRTHQIRVHLKQLGYPIVGDSVYAGRRQRDINLSADRHLLHAYKLKFADLDGKISSFTADIPSDFNQFLNQLEKL